ncbi:MAG: NAD(P)H-dependent oxidoreductase subunit E [Gammaproteobacteria bacterium]|nr:MAG: NAD(P)H-dependent oxidoreductase subunit E [Gammaproteobacteria bacterium]
MSNQQSESVLSAHACEQIDHWLGKFPPEQKKSALLGTLTVVQHENNGYLTTELMDAVAAYLDLQPIAVYEVATFYSMFETEPVGRNCIAVCTNISCMLRGADEVVEYLENKLGIALGESTADGKYFLKLEEECLAGCAGAPLMQVNHKYYEQLDPVNEPGKIDQILESLD